MSNQLEFIFTGDETKAVDAINRVVDSTNKLVPAATRATTALTGVTSSSNKFGESLKKVAPTSNSATLALTNFGRVAQDLPFGFIGIANNLNPLLESFQRLRIETGSGKAALQALGSSLMGAGGLGIALSLVTAGLSFASVGFDAWTRGMGSATDKSKEASSAIQLIETDFDRFAKRLNQSVEELSKNGSKVATLSAVLIDNTASLSKRKEVLDELVKISPKYFKSLDAEKSSYEEITKAVDGYTDSLAKQAELKALLPEIDKIIQRVVKAQVELNQLNRNGNLDLLFGGGGDEFLKEENIRLNKIIEQGKKEIKRGRDALTLIAGDSQSLVDILFGKDVDPKAVKDKIKKVREIVASDVNSNSLANVIPDPVKFRTGVQDLFGKQPKKPQFLVDFEAGMTLANIQLDNMKKNAENIANVLTNTLGSAFTTLFDNILSGSQNAFQAFGQAIKQVITKLIAAAITAAIFAAIIAASTGGGSELAKIGGFAGQFKSIFSALSGFKPPGFASGVRNFSGGLAIVGERGPELVNLPGGSDVIPNHMLGGSSRQELYAFISNRGIYLSNKRGAASAGRLGA